MLRSISIVLASFLPLAGCAGAAENNRSWDFASGKLADPQYSPPVPSRDLSAEGVSPGKGVVDFPRFPALSPDGTQLTFTWRGDLWKVSAQGGHAIRLTTHPGNDLRSAWSPDGNRIAFDSYRNGFRNIYLMNADGTDIRQVTDIDMSCTLSGFGKDENGQEVVVFSARIEGENYRSTRPYMCSTKGGEIRRIHGAFGSYPRFHADGKRVLFTRGGVGWERRHYRGSDSRDVWMWNRADDSFTQLSDWAGNDGRAAWAGPNDVIFLSDRELNCCNLYKRSLSGGTGQGTRLTSFRKEDIQDLDVSANGSIAVFMAWDSLYTLDLNTAGAQPMRLSLTANEDERDNIQVKSIAKNVSESALSPDEKVMAFVAYGEVYVRNTEDKSPTRRVVDLAQQDNEDLRHSLPHARERSVWWSPDGLKLYFVSDRSGTDSIYAATVAMTRGEVKEDFTKAMSPEEAEEGAEADHEEESKPEGDKEEEGEDSDSSEDGKDDADAEDDDKKKKKKKKKKKDLPKELQADRWHDALTFHVKPVVVTEHNDRDPQPSPDGESLAFRRGRGDLMILDLESQETRRLVEGWDNSIEWRWSPDSRHIAYHQSDLNFNADIWIVRADGSEPAVNITKHPDSDYNPRWSADGKILSFVSERINEEYDVWMVYLDSDLDVATPAELEQYYKDAAKAAKKRKPLEVKNPADEDKEEGDDKKDEDKVDEPKELDLEDAYLRLRRVTDLSGNEFSNEITPAGDRYIFTATVGKPGLFSVKWDGKDRKKLTDRASVQHVSLTGNKVVLVKGGQGATVGPEGKKVKTVAIKDSLRVDLQEQADEKFTEMARVLGENFYHPTMKGLDWTALTEKYRTIARQTRTGNEFNHVGMRLFGELSGSHLGVRSSDPRSPNAQSQGRLGTVHRRVESATSGGNHGYEVMEVVPESPAALGSMTLQPNDVIVSIDQSPFAETDTLESRMTGRIGEEVIVGIKRTNDAGESMDLTALITPIGVRALNQLKYYDWRRRNAETVFEWSNGRLGYIHIQGMSQPSLDVFERDLYAAAEGKEGLLIDVRNNGGGWTADRLLSSIMVRPHAYTIPRGADPSHVGYYPQGRLFIQRYSLPINMLCNEKSFSNAEIISHAFKTLGRGTLVGQVTHGSVISTGGTTLIDGTWVRLPFRGWFLTDGKDMENNGAAPHIIVPQTPEAESQNNDEQLRAAVDDLLKRL